VTEHGRLTVISALGVVQILAWGSSYYLPAVLAAPIAPFVGRVIGERGGRPVLAAAAMLLAAGQVILCLSPNLPIFIAGWVVIGAGMAAGLYDAAFSTLGRLYGGTARSAITVLTLWGGFASTVCWPLSAYMVALFGWRRPALPMRPSSFSSRFRWSL